MSVKRLTHDEILDAIKADVDIRKPVVTSFFTAFGTSPACQLNCHALHSHFDQNKSCPLPRERAARKQESIIRNQRDRVFFDSIQRWFTATEIASSASQGCGTCSIFDAVLRIVFQQDAAILSDGHEYCIDVSFGLKRRLRSCGGANPEEFVQLFQSRTTQMAFERLPFSEFLLGSEHSIARIRRWINGCFNSHQVCSKYSKPHQDSPRPARLLDLRSIRSGDATGIRLIDVRHDSTMRYACLSHRWDPGVDQCRTTTDNLHLAQVVIEEKKLPTNFRDAIKLTRDLGIDYLWIDSICIIQAGDGGNDLIKEMGKMGAIYQYATVTIVAASSPDSSAGCFLCDGWPDIGMTISDTSGDAHLIGARILDRRGVPASVKDVADHYPLLTRGWVFQERLLSPRLLQCNYGEFTFDCLESSQCECVSDLAPHPTGLMQGRTVGFFKSSFRRLRLPPDGRETEGARLEWKQATMRYWRSSVNIFMRTALTHPSDVLLAIAGCAQAIEPMLKTVYVAGMWEEALPIDMVWFVVPGEARAKPQPRPVDTTAPSWSWASVAIGQAINYFELTQNGGKDPWYGLIKYLQNAIQKIDWSPESSLNPLGRLKYAHLHMRSVLLHCYIRFFCDEVRPSKGQAPSRRRDLHTEDLRHLGSCITSIQGIPTGETTIDLSLDAKPDGENLDITPFEYCVSSERRRCELVRVSLLPALHRKRRERVQDVFIVLSKVSPCESGSEVYKRIGLLTLTTKTVKAPDWQKIIPEKMDVEPDEFLFV